MVKENKITMDELLELWKQFNLNQQLVLLRMNKIEFVECYNIRYDRFFKRSIDDLIQGTDHVNFHQLKKKHKTKILDYVNKTPTQFKIEKSTNEIQQEFELKIDKKAKIKS